MKLFWLAFPAFLPGNRHMHSRLHVRPPTDTNQLLSILLPNHSSQESPAQLVCTTTSQLGRSRFVESGHEIQWYIHAVG